MLVEGPMARHVADVRAGLEILAGQHWRDPRSVTAVLADAEPGERLKIAVLAEPPGGTTDAGIAAAIRSVGDRLSDAGHDVVEVDAPRVRAGDRTLDGDPGRRHPRPARPAGAR